MNDPGLILGGGNVSPDSPDDHAFLWRHGVFVDQSTAGIPNSAADLNNRAAIIATLPNATGDDRSPPCSCPTRHGDTRHPQFPVARRAR
ncbi:hypothetical protein [Actinoplanes solisilvae]|uniref:hypothetical protein n=1 Tax=Actinoplanes solisilvae TaxID=2486853 RepID=UPI000FDAF40B|nr:hypothetical protein [Actinoplanes solisilvae]